MLLKILRNLIGSSVFSQSCSVVTQNQILPVIFVHQRINNVNWSWCQREWRGNISGTYADFPIFIYQSVRLLLSLTICSLYFIHDTRIPKARGFYTERVTVMTDGG